MAPSPRKATERDIAGELGSEADANNLYSGMITRLRIAGMSCQHCVQAVFTALTPVEGVQSAQVTIGAATIEHDGRATVDTLREAIAVAGYQVTMGEEERKGLPIL